MTHTTRTVESLGTSIVRVVSSPGRAKLVELPLTPDQVPMGVRDEVAQHDGFTAEGTGSLVVDRGVIRVEAIHVHDRPASTEGVDEAQARRAHDSHARYCPVARSIAGCIQITSDLAIRRAG